MYTGGGTTPCWVADVILNIAGEPLALEAASLTADGETVVVDQGAAAQVEGAEAITIASAIGGRAAVVTIERR